MKKLFFWLFLAGSAALGPALPAQNAPTKIDGAGGGFLKKSGKKPFDFSGSLQSSASFYGANGIESRRSPLVWTVSGSPTLSVYGFSIPTTILFSDRKLSYDAPVFRRLGASPEWKWLRLHGGYRNLVFSPYTLNGLTFLGGGLELTPGIFRFSAMAGRMEPQPVVPNAEFSGLPEPLKMYRRRGLGAKIGLGRAANFFDLMFFKAKDDAATGDFAALERLNVAPAENLTVGAAFRFTFFKKFWVAANAAASGLTKDLGAQSIAEIDSIAGRQKLLSVNLSSYYYLAGDASAGLRFRRFGLGAKYQRIDPGYASFGTYFVNGDVENWTANANVSLFRNRFSLSARVGKQRNNIRQRNLFTNLRDIAALDFSVAPNKVFSVTGAFSNYSLSQQAGLVTINDTLRLANVSANFHCSPQVVLQRGERTHTASASAAFDRFADQNPFSQAQNDSETRTVSASYKIRWRPTGLFFSGSAFFNRFDYPAQRVRRAGLGAGAGRDFLKKKANARWTGSFSANETDGSRDGFVLQNALHATCKLPRKMNLTASLQWLSRKTKIQQPFSETRATVGWSARF